MNILHITDCIAIGGGPSGYLFNLKKELGIDSSHNIKIEEIPFLNRRKPLYLKLLKSLSKRNLLPKFIQKIVIGKYLKFQIFKKLDFKNVEIKLEDYPIVIAHSILVAYGLKEHLSPNQKLFIFQHSPTEFISEKLSIFKDERLINELYEDLAIIEMSVFQQANGLILPCINAVDSYFIKSKKLRKQFKELLGLVTVVELPTGVPKPVPNLNYNNQLQGIKSLKEEGKIVIGYFGRYHQHKGFDLFLKLVKKFKNNNDYIFISAGFGRDFENISQENYINLGMLDKLKDLPNAIDLCHCICIPNRCTFFDLIALEVMALGKTIFTSDTGGNKYLKQFSKGIIALPLFDLENHMFKAIKKCTINDFTEYGEMNLQAYNENFTIDRFVENHKNIVNRI